MPAAGSRTRPGRTWLVEDWEIDSIREYRREGALTWTGLARDLRGVRELAWWDPADPLPGIRCAAGLFGRLYRWALTRWGGSRTPRRAATDARPVSVEQGGGTG